MITAAELAGLFAAHAIWSVSEDESFHPMLAYTTEGGERCMDRLINDDLPAAVEHGRQKLADNSVDAVDAVLLFDGRIPVGNEKLDAVIMEMRAYFSPNSEAVIAVPYTPKSSGRFRVHKPKLLVWNDCEDFDTSAAFEAFFAGVAGHEKGAKIWNEALDESK
jgi:hypothetical protein